MPKFEYKTVKAAAYQLQETISDMENEGWELVMWYKYDLRWSLLFKKKLKNKKEQK